jgi:hypothetical protein
VTGRAHRLQLDPVTSFTVSERNAGAAPLAPWAKSARKAAKFTPWRPAPGKQRGAAPTGLGLQGSPVGSSVKRVEWRSHSGSRANQNCDNLRPRARVWRTFYE